MQNYIRKCNIFTTHADSFIVFIVVIRGSTPLKSHIKDLCNCRDLKVKMNNNILTNVHNTYLCTMY